MWILPTYRRPKLLAETLRHCAECEMSTPGLILVQGTDNLDEYKWVEETAESNWRWAYLTENLGWAQGVNYGLERDGPLEFRDGWFGFFYDDLIPKTPRFDKLLLEHLKPGHFVSANNSWHIYEDGSIARLQTGIMSGDLIRAVGFMCIPGTWACFTDDFWERLGNDLGIWIKANDVIIETNNPRKGDRPWDDSDTAGYGSAEGHELMEKDRQVYMKWIAENYHQTYARVSQLIGRQGRGVPRRRVVR